MTENLPFSSRGLKAFSPQALASKVLCRKHNTELSPVDVAGDALEARLQQAISRAQSGAAQGRMDHLDGRLIQRWILKCLCGQIAARYVCPLADGPVDNLEIPDAWVFAAFARTTWPGHWTLALRWVESDEFTLSGLDLEFQPLSKNGSIAAVEVKICGVQLVLRLDADPKSGGTFDGRIVEPVSQIEFRSINQGVGHGVVFDWPQEVSAVRPPPMLVGSQMDEIRFDGSQLLRSAAQQTDED
ncbi:hypothetical protein EWI61_02910 [Methylolobus aquaticus]|nr:hypothetical protein EWI61_02910 [Methylolobus aquaticus]